MLAAVLGIGWQSAATATATATNQSPSQYVDPFMVRGVVLGVRDEPALVVVSFAQRSWSTACLSDGGFELRLPWPVPYTLAVSASGVVPPRPLLVDFIGRGSELSVEVSLEASPPVSGVLSVGGARSGSRAFVVAAPEDDGSAAVRPPEVQAHVDESGGFTLAGLSPRLGYVLTAVLDHEDGPTLLGCWRWTSEVGAAPPSPDVLDASREGAPAPGAPRTPPSVVGSALVLEAAPPAAAWLTLVLQGADGSPFSGPASLLLRSDALPALVTPGGTPLEARDGRLLVDEGVRRLDFARAGRHVAHPIVSVPGFRPVALPPLDIVGAHERMLRLVPLTRLVVRLQGQDGGELASASGRVEVYGTTGVGSRARPSLRPFVVREWTMASSSEPSAGPESASDADPADASRPESSPDGALVVRDLMPGRIAVRVIVDGVGEAYGVLDVERPDEALVLTPAASHRPGRLEVMLRAHDGAPVSDALVAVHPLGASRGEGWQRMTTDAAGRVVFDALEPGPWEVGVESDPPLSVLRDGQRADVVADGATSLDILLD